MTTWILVVLNCFRVCGADFAIQADSRQDCEARKAALTSYKDTKCIPLVQEKANANHR